MSAGFPERDNDDIIRWQPANNDIALLAVEVEVLVRRLNTTCSTFNFTLLTVNMVVLLASGCFRKSRTSNGLSAGN